MYTLRPYQERAVQEAMADSYKYEAFDMGLGKTLITLDYLRRTGRKALVLAPLLVATRTWPQEIKKFTPDLTHVVLHGKDKGDLYRQKSDIKIINFDGLKWLYDQIAKYGSIDMKDRVLIIDEATCIKNPTSTRFRALKPMRHFFDNTGVFCLSGEPMPKGYMDIWSQYWMLDQGKALERSFSAYRKKYFYESGPPRWQVSLRDGAADAITKLIAPMTSILRAQDHLDMPESLFIEVPVELPKRVKEQYAVLKKEYLLEYGDDAELAVYADSAGVLSTKLRQLTQGALYGKDREYTVMHTAKLEALTRLVEEADGSPILCPIVFSFEATEIRRAFGYKVPLIAGGMSNREKQVILDDWDTGKLPLVLCQPASLSHGLNLQTGGHIIVWYGRPWSLELYNQLNGRLIRPGQKHPVRVYFISAQGTADDRVAKVLAEKGATQDAFKQAILDDLRH